MGTINSKLEDEGHIEKQQSLDDSSNDHLFLTSTTAVSNESSNNNDSTSSTFPPSGNRFNNNKKNYQFNDECHPESRHGFLYTHSEGHDDDGDELENNDNQPRSTTNSNNDTTRRKNKQDEKQSNQQNKQRRHFPVPLPSSRNDTTTTCIMNENDNVSFINNESSASQQGKANTGKNDINDQSIQSNNHEKNDTNENHGINGHLSIVKNLRDHAIDAKDVSESTTTISTTTPNQPTSLSSSSSSPLSPPSSSSNPPPRSSSLVSLRSFFTKSAAHLLNNTNKNNDNESYDDDDDDDESYLNIHGNKILHRHDSSKNNVRSLSNSSLFLSKNSNSNRSISSNNSNCSIIHNKNNYPPNNTINKNNHKNNSATSSSSSSSSMIGGITPIRPRPTFPKAQKMITSQQNLIMGPSPPPIYEMALIGQWKELIKRVKYYPNEVLYRDKCNNTALHLVCRRQPPYDVVECLLKTLLNLVIIEDRDTMDHENNDYDPKKIKHHDKDQNSKKNRRRKCYLGGVTMDGLTPLHFATYCGASPDVIELILRYEKDALMKYHAKKEESWNNSEEGCPSSNDNASVGSTSTNNSITNDEFSQNDDGGRISSSSIEVTLKPTLAKVQNDSQNDPVSLQKQEYQRSGGVGNVGVDDYDNHFSNHANSLYNHDGRYKNDNNKNMSSTSSTNGTADCSYSSITQSTSCGNSISSSSNDGERKKLRSSSKLRFKLPIDRRGRTALHSICAGFRTDSRPLNIYMLLSYDPNCVLVEDEKCKTALSLMYDDYAEEIEELLTMSFSSDNSAATTSIPPGPIVTAANSQAAGTSEASILKSTKLSNVRQTSNEMMKTILFFENGSMSECWKILLILLKAVYLGSVVDDENDDNFGAIIDQHSNRPFKQQGNGCEIDDENRSSCSECSGSASNDSGCVDSGMYFKSKAAADDDGYNGFDSDSCSANSRGQKAGRRKSLKKRLKQRKRSGSSSESLDNMQLGTNNNEDDGEVDDESSKLANPTTPILSQSRYASPDDSFDQGLMYESSVTDDMTTSPETNDESIDSSCTFSKGHSSTTIRRKSLTMFPTHIASSKGPIKRLTLPPLLHDESNPISTALPSFSLIHAAASIPYTCPYGFFQLLMKVCPHKVCEFDDGYHSRSKNKRSKRKRRNRRAKGQKGFSALPLHLATKSLPPSNSWFGRNSDKLKRPSMLSKNQQNLSTSFHGYSSIMYQDPSSEVVISYHSQSKSQQNKQYHTASFVQPTVSSSSMTISSWDSVNTTSTSMAYSSWMNSTVKIPTPIISHIIDAYPKAAGIPEPSSGKYPIELAIESGKSYFSVIAPLVNSFPHILYPSKYVVSDSAGSAKPVGIDRIYTSLLTALMNSSMLIRNEAAITAGCIVRKLSAFIEGLNDEEHNTLKGFFKENGGDLPNPSKIEPKTFEVEEFILQLIRSSDGTMNMGNVNDDPYSNAHFMTDDEWGIVQSTTLKALSNVFDNISPEMLSEDSDTPKKALHAAENMIRHGDVAVRESAASVLGAVLDWLRTKDASSLLHRFLVSGRKSPSDDGKGNFKGKRKKDDTSLDDNAKLSTSMHSMFSLASSSSAITQKASNVNPRLRHSLTSIDYKMLHSEWPHIKHGKALALLRLLISKKGKHLVSEEMIDYKDVTTLVKDMMLDKDIEVRKSACLAVGAILGRSTSEVDTLKLVRHTILKCMRASEEEEIHVALARGLMLATHMKPHIFVCRAGTPILECAMILGVTSKPTIQKMFYAFLWLALGVGCKDSAHSGLSDYMEIAEGENGLIMMNLVTKELSRIQSIQDVLWQ